MVARIKCIVVQVLKVVAKIKMDVLAYYPYLHHVLYSVRVSLVKIDVARVISMLTKILWLVAKVQWMVAKVI